MNRSKAPLMMIEQAMMIACFLIAAAICLRVFAYVGMSSKEMETRSRMLSLGQTVAEAYCMDDAEILSELGLVWSGCGEPVAESVLTDGQYAGLTVAVSTGQSENMWSGQVQVTAPSGASLSLPVSGQLQESAKRGESVGG